MNPLCWKFGYFLEQNNNDNDNKNDYDNSNDKNKKKKKKKKNINNDNKVAVVTVKGKIIIFFVGCLSHCCFFQFTVFLFTYFCFCPLNPSLF